TPYLPDETDAWASWISTEYKTYGQPLFDLESIYDSQGRLRAGRATKTTRGGKPAVKMAYSLTAPPSDGWTEPGLSTGIRLIALDAKGRRDFSGCDFVYCHLANASNVTMAVTDERGVRSMVGSGPPD